MNLKDEIKRRTEIQQAWLDGEIIESAFKVFGPEGRYLCDDDWCVTKGPRFEWDRSNYRVNQKVYVKPEDLEVGKTYLDETDGETMKVLEESSDKGRFWCRTVQACGEIDYALRYLYGEHFSKSKFIEVQEDDTQR